jgi:hypothetical protein
LCICSIGPIILIKKSKINTKSAVKVIEKQEL